MGWILSSQERGRIVGRGKENTVVGLAPRDDREVWRVKDLAHVVGSQAAAFAEASKDATVILDWSGSRELLRTVLPMCAKVRWVHSRAAGLDNLLVPQLVEGGCP